MNFIPSCPHWTHLDRLPEMENPSVLNKICKRSGPEFTNLVGCKRGRLTVVGIFKNRPKGERVKWVVRCVCGDYETRSSKALKNDNNNDDMCSICRKRARLIEEYKRKIKI